MGYLIEIINDQTHVKHIITLAELSVLLNNVNKQPLPKPGESEYPECTFTKKPRARKVLDENK